MNLKFFLLISFYFFIAASCSENQDTNETIKQNQDPYETTKQNETVPKSFTGEKVLLRPKKQPRISKNVENKYEKISLKEFDSTNELWIVISDRDNNPTYTSTSSNKEFKKINFKEKYYVGEEKGDWLRLVKDKRLSTDIPFSETAEDIGWIKKDNVLHWNVSLKNKLSGVNIKALTINTIDYLKKNNLENIDKVSFHNSPQLNDISSSFTPMYRVFYVYKVKGESLLVGKSSNINSYDDYSEIIGWVDRSRFIIWDNRIAIEPNWEIKNTCAKSNPIVFAFENMADHYKGNKELVNEIVVWKSGIRYKRLPGNQFRFPVFSSKNEIIHVGAVGSVQKADGKLIPNIYETREVINEAIVQTRNINILFVIDFTQSMEPYIDEISEVITKKIPELKEKYKNNNIKFAVFGYRDIVNGSRALITERPSFKFTSSTSQIKEFLDNATTHNTENHSEMLFNGMKEALKWNEIENHKNNTNVVIVIGDTGNKKSDYYDDLVDLINKNRCHLMGFQVKHKNILEEGVNPYEEFPSQLLDIIFTASTQRSELLRQKLGKSIIPKIKTERNTIKLIDAPLVGRIYKCPPESEANIKLLHTYIDNLIEDANTITNKSVFALKEGTSVKLPSELVSTDNEVFGESLEAIVWDIMLNTGVDRATIDDVIIDDKFQFVIPGYTAYKPFNCEDPVYKYCIYISLQELAEIVYSMKLLTTQGDKRLSLFKAFHSLLEAKLGEDIAKNYSDPKEITNILFGLPSSNSIFDGLENIEHLKDQTLVSDSKIDNYWKHINTAVSRLENILDGDDNCPYLVDELDKYFWIPQDLLP